MHPKVGDAAVCNFHMDDAIDPEVRKLGVQVALILCCLAIA